MSRFACVGDLQPKHVVMVPPGMKPKSATTSAGKLKKKPEVVSYALRLVANSLLYQFIT